MSRFDGRRRAVDREDPDVTSGGRDGAAAIDFLELARHQRAHRSYSGERVDDAVVARLLRAATFAPSSENRQPWVFVVVRDPERRAAIGRIMAELWAGGGRDYAEGRSDPKLLLDVDAGIAGGGIAAAPVLVVVGGDTTLVPRAMLKSSIFPAVQNLLLAAVAEGLGGALTTIATLRAAELAEIVGFPATVDPIAVVPLGRPGRALGPARRRPFEDTTHREQFGTPWDGAQPLVP
jgi:nitroreductase